MMVVARETPSHSDAVLRISGILSALIIVLTEAYFSRHVASDLSILDYFKPLGLAALFLLLPFNLTRWVNARTSKFKGNEGVITICLLLLLPAFGLLLKNSVILEPFMWLVTLTCVGAEFLRQVKHRSSLPEIIAVTMTVLLFALFCFKSNPFLPGLIQAVTGQDYPDRLFHAAICNMVSACGFASTGIDGIPLLKYHWGSHYVFAGLRQWIGFSALDFYRLAYVPIFVPLTLKAIVHFSKAIGFELKTAVFSSTIMLVLSLLLSLNLMGMSGGVFTNSESFTLSMIFAFYFLAIIISRIRENRLLESHLEYIFSVLLICIVCFLKVSTGLILMSGYGFLVFRSEPVRSAFLKVTLLVCVAMLLILNLIHNGESLHPTKTLHDRYTFFWEYSDSFITYTCGIWVSLFAVFIGEKRVNGVVLKRAFANRKYLHLEALVVMTFCGLALGLYASSFPPDTYYFGVVPFLISIPVFVAYLSKGLIGEKTSSRALRFISVVVVILSIFSRPDAINSFYHKNKSGYAPENLTENQQLLRSFLSDLSKQKRLHGDCGIAVYVPQSENNSWLYGYSEHEIVSTLLIPSVSALPAVGGISQLAYDNKEEQSYSMESYQYSNRAAVENIDDAIKRAKKYGFETLLAYDVKEGALTFKLVNVNSPELNR